MSHSITKGISKQYPCYSTLFLKLKLIIPLSYKGWRTMVIAVIIRLSPHFPTPTPTPSSQILITMVYIIHNIIFHTLRHRIYGYIDSTHRQHDGAVLLDLREELVCVEQLSKNASSLVHHIKPLSLCLHLGKGGLDSRHTTRLD